MKIALLSPLYPPDIAELASYTKVLAKRLKEHHELTILTYGYLPEPIEGVKIIAVDKRVPLPLRLIRFIGELRGLSKKVDLIYAQNGASVEFPLIVMSLISSTPYILRMGDHAALARAEKRLSLQLIDRVAQKRAQQIFFTEHGDGAKDARVVIEGPLPQPEILPFRTLPTDMSDYENSWGEHCKVLEKLFSHGT